MKVYVVRVNCIDDDANKFSTILGVFDSKQEVDKILVTTLGCDPISDEGWAFVDPYDVFYLVEEFEINTIKRSEL